MTKGRKTTFEERVEIASYCISLDHNYAETVYSDNTAPCARSFRTTLTETVPLHDYCESRAPPSGMTVHVIPERGSYLFSILMEYQIRVV